MEDNKKKMRKPLTEEDMKFILEAIDKAYKEAGRELTTATLIDENASTLEEGKLLLDRRKKDKLN